MMSTPLTRDEVIAFLEGRGWVRTGRTSFAGDEYKLIDGRVTYFRHLAADSEDLNVHGDDSHSLQMRCLDDALASDGITRDTLRATYVRAELAKGAKK